MDADELNNLNESVQAELRSDDEPRARAERAVALIGRRIAQETGGVLGAVVWGTTSIKPPRVSRNRWRFLSKR